MKSIFKSGHGNGDSKDLNCSSEKCLDEIEFLQELINSIEIVTQDGHLVNLDAENPQEQEEHKNKGIYGAVNELTLVLQNRVDSVKQSRSGKLSTDLESLRRRSKNSSADDPENNRARFALKQIVGNIETARKMEQTAFNSNLWNKYQPPVEEGSAPCTPLIWHANGRNESSLGYVSEESEEDSDNEDENGNRAPYEGLAPLKTLPRPQDVSFGIGSVVHDYLERQGYYCWPGVSIPMANISKSVKTLVEDGWPASFIFMLDQAWDIILHVWDLAAPVLGQECLLEPTFFATCSLPDPTNLGASELSANLHQPHRNYSSHESTFPDGYERLLQIWVPLTDETADGGCFCVVPREFDDSFDTAGCNAPVVQNEAGDAIINFDLSGMRSVPGAQGSVILFRGNAIHWTTRPRSTDLPQSSICCTFRHMQSSDFPSGNGLTREQIHNLGRTGRLQLICRSLLLHHPKFEDDCLPRLFWDKLPEKLKKELRSMK